MPFCGSPKVAYQRPGLHSGLCEYSECDGRVQKGKSAYRPVPMLNLMPLGGGTPCFYSTMRTMSRAKIRNARGRQRAYV